MKYTHTHAHLYRNKKRRAFGDIGVGDCATRTNDIRFFVKINEVEKVTNHHGLPVVFVYNAVRIETGELMFIESHETVIVAKDVEVKAKF